MTKVLTVAGTRPELIRLSRLIPVLDERADHHFVHTGQNVGSALRDQFFDELDIRAPDRQLALSGASPSARVAAVLVAIDEVVEQWQPDRMVILGDTDSGLAAYVAARRGVPVFHLEAGNRAYDPSVPEEVNRRVIDHLSTVLLPYTESSASNLVAEGIAPARIEVIGNPISEVLDVYRSAIEASTCRERLGVPERFILATVHRAETTDDPTVLREVVTALAEVGGLLDAPVVFPVHPRTVDHLAASGVELDPLRFLVVPPLGLLDFVHLEARATLVLTDSGTVQEEAALLGVPTVLVRDVTERPELLECGAVLLGGRTASTIVAAAQAMATGGPSGRVPPEYRYPDVASRAAGIILGPLPDVGSSARTRRRPADGGVLGS